MKLTIDARKKGELVSIKTTISGGDGLDPHHHFIWLSIEEWNWLKSKAMVFANGKVGIRKLSRDEFTINLDPSLKAQDTNYKDTP